MDIPVVLIMYHRPDMTAKVISSLRDVKPSEIFVIADGPKNPADAENCKKTRGLIDSIDWKCKIYKNYSSKNLGLRERVVSGLNWVFTKVDKAIILEDDLSIDKSFYRFCAEMLYKYKDNKKIISITGDNFLFGKYKTKDSYFFSKYTYSWGWATWRRAWKLYDDTMHDWPELKKHKTFKNILRGYVAKAYWTKIFDLTYQRKINSWAYCWTYTSFARNMLTIVPSYNLVSNIGFGSGATHTSLRSNVFGIPISTMDFPMRHPKEVVHNSDADSVIERNLYFRPRIVAGLIAQSIFYKLKV